jgi:hypothetical protein
MLDADVRTLRQLHEDLGAHSILVKRRGGLGEEGAGGGQEAFHCGQCE